MALRSRVGPHRGDGWMVAVFAIGATGVPSHFWIEEYSGMEGSGVPGAGGGGLASAVGWRRRSRAPPCPRRSRRTSALAAFNLLLGGAPRDPLWRTTRRRPGSPAPLFGKVFAHAHLLALGFALMTVMAAGYRLLPMILPSAMPSGRRLWATAALLEGGTLALAAGLLMDVRPWVWTGGGAAIAATALFLANVGWMLRHPRAAAEGGARRPTHRPSWRSGRWSAWRWPPRSARSCWRGASPRRRACAPPTACSGSSASSARWSSAWRSASLPWLAWLWGYAERDYLETPPPPWAIPGRGVQAVIVTGWWVGAAATALGAWVASVPAVRGGAVLLTAAAAASTVQWGRSVRVARGRWPRRGS